MYLKLYWWYLNHLVVKADSFDVVKDVEQVGLDCVGVRGLAKDLKQGCVRDKEEPRKQEPLLLQIAERQHNRYDRGIDRGN